LFPLLVDWIVENFLQFLDSIHLPLYTSAAGNTSTSPLTSPGSLTSAGASLNGVCSILPATYCCLTVWVAAAPLPEKKVLLIFLWHVL
jgi:hypothetical protein